ncbi:MAG: hypothetical protein M1814_003613 [Vezdaea aestivalis]|nr:MAG: hypothetical protein M1814_003613 [Vezdaea aestivalis]
MSDNRKSTFRVTNIPSSYNRESLQKKLSEALHIDDSSNLWVHSLASDVCDSHLDLKRLIATVTFAYDPVLFQSRKRTDDGPRNAWQVSLERHSPVLSEQKVCFDTNFEGFTPLSSVEDEHKQTIDCIVLHGWGGHAFGSFKDRDGYYMWLRDSLAKDIPQLRIILYGYKSSLIDNTIFAGIEEWTESLCNSLLMLQTQPTAFTQPEHHHRPIIFLAHSIEAMTLMSKSSKSALVSILKRTYSALLFGVPSLGMDTEALATMIGEGLQLAVANQLEQGRDNRWRERKHLDYCDAFSFKDSRVIRFFEGSLSDTLKFRWLSNGPKRLLVSRESAIYGRSCDHVEDSIRLDGDHRTMVKFNENNCSNYRLVKFQLQELTAVASKVINDRFGYEPLRSKSESDISAEEGRALQSLYFPEMTLREDEIKEASVDTCDWLLKHEVYCDWLHKGGLLWIEGKPGAGKSTLMQFAVKIARQREARGEVKVAAFFIYGQGASLQKTLIGVWRSVLHQILTNNQALRLIFQSVFSTNNKSRGTCGQHWHWSSKELQEIFRYLVTQTLATTPIEVYIDALDESGKESATELIEFFRRSISSIPQFESHLKICFACRHYPILRLDEGFRICVEDENSAAISSYIRSELGHFEDLSGISEDILKRSNGVFQWVKLVVKAASELKISGSNSKRIQRKVNEQPKSLFGIYENLVSEITPEDLPRALLLAQWICFSIWPLSLQQHRFTPAFDIESPYSSFTAWQDSEDYVENDSSMIKVAANLLKGLVEVKIKPRSWEKTDVELLQFIHQSVRDFFVEGGGLNILGMPSHESVVAASHCRLSRSCLKFFEFDQVQRISGLENVSWLGGLGEDMLERYGEPAYGISLLEYVTEGLFEHAYQAEKEGLTMHILLDDFSWPSTPKYRLWAARFCLSYQYFESEIQLKLDCLLCALCCFGISGAARGLLDSQESTRVQTLPCRLALYWASRAKHVTLVNLLLEKGAGISCEVNNSCPLIGLLGYHYDLTASIRTSSKEEMETIARLLINRGMDMDSRDPNGNTAICLASSNGIEAVVRLLLKEGVDVNARAESGKSALHIASYEGYEAIVRLLLENGADINAQTELGRSALYIASYKGYEAIVRLLLENGADVNARTEEDEDALYNASSQGHEAIVRLLLENGADVNARTEWGHSAFHVASEGGHEAIVRLLLENGANTNADWGGESRNILYAALYGSNEGTV